MSLADAALFHALERRVQALEPRLDAETTGGLIGTPGAVPSAQRPADDAQTARVIAALADGASIRDVAQSLGVDRNRVFRLRQRAIAAGLLPVSHPSHH